MTREDVAKAYIESAQARAARAGVIAFGSALALVTLWSAELQPRTGGLLKALAAKPRHEYLSRQKADVQERRKKGAERLENAQNSGSKRVDKISGYVQALEAKATRLGDQAQTIADQKKEATNVTFRIPGLPDIEVKDTAAAFVWLAFAAVTLLYLAWCRHSVLALYSRALRILITDIEVKPAILSDVAGPLPFWIAPLPRRDGSHVSVRLLRSSAGWDRTWKRNYLIVTLLQLAAALIVLHVVYLGIVFSQVIVPVSDRALLLKNTPVLPVTIIVGLTFAGVALWWLTPGQVPDTYSSEASGPRLFSRDRRAVVLTGLGFAAAALSLVIVSPATTRRAILRPRFRKWTNRKPLSMGFYEAGRNKRIHYGSGGNRPRVLKSVPDVRIRKVEPEADQLTRLHPAAVGPWIAAASSRLKMSEKELAREGINRTLSAAKAGERPSLIWFDRYAQQARTSSAADLRQTIDSLDALTATAGGKEIEGLIQRRRRQWSGWAAKLDSDAAAAPTSKTKA